MRTGTPGSVPVMCEVTVCYKTRKNYAAAITFQYLGPSSYIILIMFGIEGCLIVHLPHEIMWNANLMQQGNFIDKFLARHVSGTHAHHQEH